MMSSRTLILKDRLRLKRRLRRLPTRPRKHLLRTGRYRSQRIPNLLQQWTPSRSQPCPRSSNQLPMMTVSSHFQTVSCRRPCQSPPLWACLLSLRRGNYRSANGLERPQRPGPLWSKMPNEAGIDLNSLENCKIAKMPPRCTTGSAVSSNLSHTHWISSTTFRLWMFNGTSADATSQSICV